LATRPSTPGTQGTLTASIAQPIGENLPIFDMLPPGPRIISLDQTLPKKKAGFFLDMPTRSPVPRVPLGYSPATSKLRGFGSMTLGPSGGSSSGISLTSGKPGALVLNKTETRGTSVGPDFLGRSSSPALGSGARQSVKKVILDKKIDPSELFVKSAVRMG
jgi:nuclear pore complex protein Nup98-Nup96